MASYKDAVAWIAAEDAAGDTPADMPVETAFEGVDGLMTVVLVADLWSREPWRVAIDVLRTRGFRIPRSFVASLASARGE